ncbi:LysR family transcriptional regulator [Rhodococcus sp. 14-2483-1-2]|uniref:LysR family transcriptional regulator n=1 Tax=Rhodococcus sp. 14-2483-1-2 TaxID=2023147 RepID=UPI00207B0EA6|nr:LysR family transcriptional regulator [Rhodococcus sp. 14-2483-1-2]
MTPRRRLNPDDLLVLLEVGRSGRFTRAAEVLGLAHTTVSRRIAALERDVGGRLLSRVAGGWELTSLGEQALSTASKIDSMLRELSPDNSAGPPVMEDVVRVSCPDGFSVYVAAPAAARLHRRHPGVSVEIVSLTRRAVQHRSGVDVEIVVGKPRVKADSTYLASYSLGLYGARFYLDDHEPIVTVAQTSDHSLVYFIDSMLQVDYVDLGRQTLPPTRDAVTSTNVLAHVEATRSGAGLGLLPTFIADRHDDLVRVLAAEVSPSFEYWMVTRVETVRWAAVAAFISEMRATISAMKDLQS